MLTTVLVCTVTIFCAIRLAMFIWRRKKMGDLIKDIPGPSDTFMIGNFEFLKKLTYNTLDTYNEALETYPNIVKHWAGPDLCVVINSPELMQEVLTVTNFLQKPKFYEFMRTDFGLMCSKYFRWRVDRKLMNHTFNLKILESFLPLFNIKSEKLIENLADKVNGGEFDVYTLLAKCTFNTVFATSFGIDIPHNDREDVVIESLDKAYSIAAKRMSTFYLHPNIIYNLTSYCREQIKNLNVCTEYVDTYLGDKLEQIRLMEFEKTDEDSYFKPQIFLDQLIKISKTIKKLSVTEIRNHCDTIIFGALETTALSTSHFLLMMALHPKIQEKVYREITEVFPSNVSTIDQDILKKLVYTEQCIKETMRLFPVGALLGREPMEDGCLGEYKVGAGTNILLNIYSLHRRTDIWGDDANQYRPDRFSKDNSEKRHPFAYLPFSAGPRNCIGYRYASVLMQMMIMRCVREFKFSTSLTFEDLKCEFKFTLKLNTKHLLTVQKRNG